MQFYTAVLCKYISRNPESQGSLTLEVRAHNAEENEIQREDNLRGIEKAVEEVQRRIGRKGIFVADYPTFSEKSIVYLYTKETENQIIDRLHLQRL